MPSVQNKNQSDGTLIPLVEFEDLQHEYSFVRDHKTHLVNLRNVIAYEKTDGGIFQLANGDKVSISRRSKEHFSKISKIR